jgi:hypothetical protein
MLTAGNASDSTTLQKYNLSCLKGKLVGYNGYFSAALAKYLSSFGVSLITKLKKKSKDKSALRLLKDAYLLRRRGMVESVLPSPCLNGVFDQFVLWLGSLLAPSRQAFHRSKTQ